MKTSLEPSNASLVYGAMAAAAIIFSVIPCDAIAQMKKDGDISLTGEPARSSPQADIVLNFLTALRASDLKTMMQLTTTKQGERLQQEMKKPTPDFQQNTKEMLGDLPADRKELRGIIKYVQMHKERGLVSFETKRNSWFVTLENVAGTWKVAGF
ncbi:MAG: hypothetical protein H7125_12990 [Proteobacteria bacterium]|nr:hypothetical protein [Burkholderiales bacterium]